VVRLLARDGVEVVDVSTGARRAFPVSRTAADPTVEGPDDPTWLAAWQEADASVARQLDRLVDEAGFTAYHVAATVSRALPPAGLLVVGASNPIRDLDLMATAYDVGSRRKVIANRGLSGIDGTVSTAVGASLSRTTRYPDSRNLALMGDVTFLHDANGLVIGPEEPRPDLTIVVVNDDGGSIFATLEQGAADYAYAYERLFGTPHRVDLAALCQATRTPHWRVDSAAELDHALSSPNGGIDVVEAVVDRTRRRELDLAIRALRP
jgi:2-succinyl-5-enolpyruvyl-6-hydroxy-3-cyclohexene-1-carboxylate synthase